MDITRPPGHGYLSELRFSSGEHVLTTGEKKFYQHTVTKKSISFIAICGNTAGSPAGNARNKNLNL